MRGSRKGLAKRETEGRKGSPDTNRSHRNQSIFGMEIRVFYQGNLRCNRVRQHISEWTPC